MPGQHVLTRQLLSLQPSLLLWILLCMSSGLHAFQEAGAFLSQPSK